MSASPRALLEESSSLFAAQGACVLGTSFAPAEQLTPRVAATAEAAASLSLLAPATLQRLLALLDHVAELAELGPASNASWDREREPTGALALSFGSTSLRYRIDDSDASVVIEEVRLRPGAREA
jgi:hypothetical protein